MAIRSRLFSAMLAAGFLLGIHEGRVALWQGSDPEPVYVSEYPADVLPEQDRQALRQGIRVPDQATASARMEDFSS